MKLPNLYVILFQKHSVILVTAQLLVFGYYRYAHSNYYSDNRIGFSHLFLGKAWDPVREIDTYPPSTGALALYEKVTDVLNGFRMDDTLKITDIENKSDDHIVLYFRRRFTKCLTRL